MCKSCHPREKFEPPEGHQCSTYNEASNEAWAKDDEGQYNNFRTQQFKLLEKYLNENPVNGSKSSLKTDTRNRESEIQNTLTNQITQWLRIKGTRLSTDFGIKITDKYRFPKASKIVEECLKRARLDQDKIEREENTREFLNGNEEAEQTEKDFPGTSSSSHNHNSVTKAIAELAMFTAGKTIIPWDSLESWQERQLDCIEHYIQSDPFYPGQLSRGSKVSKILVFTFERLFGPDSQGEPSLHKISRELKWSYPYTTSCLQDALDSVLRRRRQRQRENQSNDEEWENLQGESSDLPEIPRPTRFRGRRATRASRTKVNASEVGGETTEAKGTSKSADSAQPKKRDDTEKSQQAKYTKKSKKPNQSWTWHASIGLPSVSDAVTGVASAAAIAAACLWINRTFFRDTSADED